jgi:hypothetical protein
LWWERLHSREISFCLILIVDCRLRILDGGWWIVDVSIDHFYFKIIANIGKRL